MMPAHTQEAEAINDDDDDDALNLWRTCVHFPRNRGAVNNMSAARVKLTPRAPCALAHLRPSSHLRSLSISLFISSFSERVARWSPSSCTGCGPCMAQISSRKRLHSGRMTRQPNPSAQGGVAQSKVLAHSTPAVVPFSSGACGHRPREKLTLTIDPNTSLTSHPIQYEELSSSQLLACR